MADSKYQIASSSIKGNCFTITNYGNNNNLSVRLVKIYRQQETSLFITLTTSSSKNVVDYQVVMTRKPKTSLGWVIDRIYIPEQGIYTKKEETSSFKKLYYYEKEQPAKKLVDLYRDKRVVISMFPKLKSMSDAFVFGPIVSMKNGDRILSRYLTSSASLADTVKCYNSDAATCLRQEENKYHNR